ncbi:MULTISPECIES: MarR family transcriptional regulator [unclassified Pseudodesulfovibrio]|uniref:MarR family winged helix-turn-helix transcriptional regulator n=1 Tax=unclassified Pseudodesulfovibrio TaxID=2661612 RepID=UPI000FEB9EDA|nr:MULTISPECIES: MarR family transcriptional regulator [unclassified Pseudodesulfovibrio]MCJ2165173.1 MarR family transcriptional regulator [Pseudodesulfovibrio sp. S3-i]RWU03377.1 MarR family transcriptional regulator [Pseudodesulfovibrio sp. S3]
MSNNPEHLFYFSLSRFTRLYTKGLSKRLEPHGIKPGYLEILFQLWQQDNVTQKELLAMLDIEQATLSNTLKRMERDGFLLSTRKPGDRRLTQLQLTDSGRAIQKVVSASIDDLQATVNSGLTINDRKYFRRILHQMTEQVASDLEEGCLILFDEVSD